MIRGRPVRKWPDILLNIKYHMWEMRLTVKEWFLVIRKGVRDLTFIYDAKGRKKREKFGGCLTTNSFIGMLPNGPSSLKGRASY